MNRLLLVMIVLSLSAAIPAHAQLATNTPVPLPPRTAVPTATDKPLSETTPMPDAPPSLGDRERWEGQQFQIADLAVDESFASAEPVTVTVINLTSEQRRGLVWYLLAPPGDAEPWLSAVYAAPEQQIDLEAGASAEIRFAAPSESLIGEFALSVWVHQFDDGDQRQHSDGVLLPAPLLVGSAFAMRIESVDFFPQEDGGLLFVTFRFRNDAERAIPIGYSFSAAAPDDPTPWLTGAYNLPFQSIILPPASIISITARAAVELPAGDYQITGWMQELVDGSLQVHSSSVYHPRITAP